MQSALCCVHVYLYNAWLVVIMIISGHALMGTEGRNTFPFMDREPKYYSLFWGPGITDDFFLLN